MHIRWGTETVNVIFAKRVLNFKEKEKRNI